MPLQATWCQMEKTTRKPQRKAPLEKKCPKRPLSVCRAFGTPESPEGVNNVRKGLEMGMRALFDHFPDNGEPWRVVGQGTNVIGAEHVFIPRCFHCAGQALISNDE